MEFNVNFLDQITIHSPLLRTALPHPLGVQKIFKYRGSLYRAIRLRVSQKYSGQDNTGMVQCQEVESYTYYDVPRRCKKVYTKKRKCKG